MFPWVFVAFQLFPTCMSTNLHGYSWLLNWRCCFVDGHDLLCSNVLLVIWFISTYTSSYLKTASNLLKMNMSLFQISFAPQRYMHVVSYMLKHIVNNLNLVGSHLRTVFHFIWHNRLSKSESDVNEGLDSFNKDISPWSMRWLSDYLCYSRWPHSFSLSAPRSILFHFVIPFHSVPIFQRL